MRTWKSFTVTGALAPILALAASTTNTWAASTDGHDFGLGAELGEPTGLVAKYWHNRTVAIDFGLSYSFSDFFLFYADYLYHFNGAFSGTSGSGEAFLSHLTPYIGIGAELFVNTESGRLDKTYYAAPGSSDVGLGIRIPLGLEWLAPRDPIGVFVEVAPGIGFVPATWGFLQADIGARYYF